MCGMLEFHDEFEYPKNKSIAYLYALVDIKYMFRAALNRRDTNKLKLIINKRPRLMLYSTTYELLLEFQNWPLLRRLLFRQPHYRNLIYIHFNNYSAQTQCQLLIFTDKYQIWHSRQIICAYDVIKKYAGAQFGNDVAEIILATYKEMHSGEIVPW
jgi:hypothetical protein